MDQRIILGKKWASITYKLVAPVILFLVFFRLIAYHGDFDKFIGSIVGLITIAILSWPIGFIAGYLCSSILMVGLDKQTYVSTKLVTAFKTNISSKKKVFILCFTLSLFTSLIYLYVSDTSIMPKIVNDQVNNKMEHECKITSFIDFSLSFPPEANGIDRDGRLVNHTYENHYNTKLKMCLILIAHTWRGSNDLSVVWEIRDPTESKKIIETRHIHHQSPVCIQYLGLPGYALTKNDNGVQCTLNFKQLMKD